jgi:hypothetical protein
MHVNKYVGNFSNEASLCDSLVCIVPGKLPRECCSG